MLCPQALLLPYMATTTNASQDALWSRIKERKKEKSIRREHPGHNRESVRALLSIARIIIIILIIIKSIIIIIVISPRQLKATQNSFILRIYTCNFKYIVRWEYA